jgi:uncharacterized membrane protein HdeD (DUF308 family)
MSQSIDLQGLEKESRRLFSEDGMLYIFLGLLLLLVGSSFIVPALIGLVGFSAFLMYPLELVRRRITYPRVGYAKFKAPPGFLRGLLGFMLLVVIALAAIAFVGDGRFQQLLPLAISVVFALAFYFGVSSHGPQPVDWFFIGLTLISGLFASWRYDDWHTGTAVLFTIVGLFSIVVGLAKLVRFLRKYPLPAEVETS